MSNVLTWRTALDKGLEPRLYPYAAMDIPTGEFVARLDFKIWSKRAYTISCYFTETATGNKFQLSVYRRHDDHVYGLTDGSLDFKECAVDAEYLIMVGLTEKVSVVFQRATLTGF